MDSFVVPFFLLMIVNNVYSEHCSAEENFVKCKSTDNDCIREKLEPNLRAWMLKEQPGYFLESLNPITFTELPIPTSKGLYKLLNVQITGFPEAKLMNNKYSAEEGLIEFAYEFNFDLTADGFIDATGQSLLKDGPLIVHFDNLLVQTKTEATTVSRCGEKHIKFNNSQVTVRKSSDDDTVFKSGLQNVEAELKQTLAQIVGKASMKRIADNYRQITTIIPITTFWE